MAKSFLLTQVVKCGRVIKKSVRITIIKNDGKEGIYVKHCGKRGWGKLNIRQGVLCEGAESALFPAEKSVGISALQDA